MRPPAVRTGLERFRFEHQALPEIEVDLIHGRMKAAEKERGMQAFKDGLIQLLVATTVIEVGVDVPNASLMIIENAERMGLSHAVMTMVARDDLAAGRAASSFRRRPSSRAT